MFVSIQTVRKGDTIRETYLDGKGRLQVEKGPGSKVSNIEHRACSSLGTHINRRECFDSTALVWRERGELVVQEFDVVEILDVSLSATGLGEIISVDPAEQLLVEIFSDPERLDGAQHMLFHQVDNGLVSVNDVRRIAGLKPV